MPSVITSQVSWVSISAMATLKRLRTRCTTDLTTMRLPLSEPFSGRCSATRATPTCIAMLVPGCLDTGLRLTESEAFDDLIESGAELLLLLGGCEARTHTYGVEPFDNRHLKRARLLFLTRPVALAKGQTR